MRAFEIITEDDNLPWSFWYNPKTDKLIKLTGGMEHIDYVRDNPKVFGLSFDDIKHVDTTWKRGWDTKILELAADNGWVRGGSGSRLNELFLQTTEWDTLISALRKLYKKYYFERAFVDTFVEDFYHASWTALEGKELEYFIKHGEFMPRNRDRSRITQFLDSDNSKETNKTFNCRWCKKDFESEFGQFCPHCHRLQGRGDKFSEK